jgi:hypothetical protein
MKPGTAQSYLGRICLRKPDHGGLKYLSSHGCVGCSHERSAERHRKDREARKIANAYADSQNWSV